MKPFCLIVLALLFCAPAPPVQALVSEGRPGIPYFNHVFIIDRKVMEGDEVLWISLAYGPSGGGELKCSNTIDVLGGRELFRDIPEQSWALVDYELQSILVEGGFIGDADVSRVRPCAGADACGALRARLEADPDEVKRRQQVARPQKTEPASLGRIEQDLEIGRRLVRSARCRGCHTIEGFGAGHAPSLTWRRFKYESGWLATYLDAPYRMRPGMTDVMMLRYTSTNAQPNLQPPEAKAVADYLSKAGWTKSPTDRFRAEPWGSYACYDCHRELYQEEPLVFVPTPIPEDLRRDLEASTVLPLCVACHPFGDLSPGNPSGLLVMTPDLLLAMEKLEINYLVNFVRDPVYLQPGSVMPKLDLTDGQFEELRRLAIRVKESIARGTLQPVHTVYRMKKRTKEGSPGKLKMER